MSCSLQAASSGLIPGSPRARRLANFVPVDYKYIFFLYDKKLCIYSHLVRNIDNLEHVIQTEFDR